MKVPVSEIFGPTIQGEGPVIGRPTVFVRTGGCDYRCSWCDSLHAVLPQHRAEWQDMTPEEIMEAITAISPTPIMVTFSGGNPCMHSGLGRVIELGHQRGYDFCVETQGTIAAHWLPECDWVVISPKPPSSDMTPKLAQLDKCVELATANKPPLARRVALKVVVFGAEDMAFAERIFERWPGLALYLSVGNRRPPDDPAAGGAMASWPRGEADRDELLLAYSALCEKVIERGWSSVTVLPQLHVLAWGNKRGV